MPSWVRYSVSAYLGLLLAGSIATPVNTTALEQRMASIYEQQQQNSTQETYYLIPGPPPPPPTDLTES